jgi:virulence-associated protein VagC
VKTADVLKEGEYMDGSGGDTIKAGYCQILNFRVYYERKELSMMDDMILSVNTLPYPLHRRFRSERVRVREENGVVTLTPVQEPQEDAWAALSRLRDILSDGRLSTESYVAQKQRDKELEG